MCEEQNANEPDLLCLCELQVGAKTNLDIVNVVCSTVIVAVKGIVGGGVVECELGIFFSQLDPILMVNVSAHMEMKRTERLTLLAVSRRKAPRVPGGRPARSHTLRTWVESEAESAGLPDTRL